MSKPTKPLGPKRGLSLEDLDKLCREPVKIAIPLGSIFVPLIMGIIANSSSFEVSLYVYPAAFLVAFLLILAAQPHLKLAE